MFGTCLALLAEEEPTEIELLLNVGRVLVLRFPQAKHISQLPFPDRPVDLLRICGGEHVIRLLSQDAVPGDAARDVQKLIKPPSLCCPPSFPLGLASAWQQFEMF